MAGNQIYVDIEEEILEVLERVRGASSDDLTLIVPARSNVGRSRFNFQLLQRCAEQTGKRLVVASAEQGVEEMAAQSGLEVEGRQAAAATGKGPVVVPPRAHDFEERVPGAPGTVDPWEEPASLAKTPSLPRVRAQEGVFGASTPGRGVLYVGLAILAISALLLLILFVPSATVRLVTEAIPFTQVGDLQAQPGKPPVRTRVAELSKQITTAFKATGVKVTPATPATGTLVYTNHCPLVSLLSVPDGQAVHAGPIGFMQQGELQLPGGSSRSVTVKAQTPGTASNVEASRITTLDGNPYPSCLTITNPDPVGGGTDEKREPQISQADVDQARQKMELDLHQQIKAGLGQQAHGGEVLNDAVAFPLPPEFSSDHQPNDVATDFSASMQLKGQGTFFSPDDVRKALVDNLQKKATDQFPSRRLLSDQVKTDFKVTGTGDGGQLSLTGSASGYLAPKFDYEQIRSGVAGKPHDQAVRYLKTLSVRSTEIDEAPISLPFMPLLASRIDVKVTVVNGPAHG